MGGSEFRLTFFGCRLGSDALMALASISAPVLPGVDETDSSCGLAITDENDEEVLTMWLNEMFEN